MKVSLISWPAVDADLLCGQAAATCYNGKNPKKSLATAISGGHLSVVEHAVFTFRIEGVSRALLAQLTRHRIASYSVESQRYVDYRQEPEWVVPETIKDNDAVEFAVRTIYKRLWQNYRELIDLYDIPPEDARMILPNGTPTNIVMTMNARELLHFFSLRCCNCAQWEIRETACKMLELVRGKAPMLFELAGPGCVRGKCPEGKRSCGKPWKAVL